MLEPVDLGPYHKLAALVRPVRSDLAHADELKTLIHSEDLSYVLKLALAAEFSDIPSFVEWAYQNGDQTLIVHLSTGRNISIANAKLLSTNANLSADVIEGVMANRRISTAAMRAFLNALPEEFLKPHLLHRLIKTHISRPIVNETIYKRLGKLDGVDYSTVPIEWAIKMHG
jgi:hypothetical protein